ncbi:MAG TPA: hypothetical protein VMW28_02885 [Pelolinea sp.]|nr:hypothetical protein [Pelolinea sp.]
MPDISLRTYHRRIEGWIEDNNLDKAISQISLLLTKYPKNLQAWQALSKVMLQKTDFDTADRIFDLILKIDPDDFVSHIGKSMIAENRNNLDDSIEHMRRAFEIQPANEGLQNEIKRLNHKKDGVEPNKIRLTRGALIKMYIRGGLFEQSISEAEIGLHESPQRLDYQIALAESLDNTGDFIKAVEVSVRIIRQLPYCLKANEVLYTILSKSSKKDLADVYFKRLAELDPYYAYKLPTTSSVLDVPDIAVMVTDETDQPDNPVNIDNLIINSWEKPGQDLDSSKSDFSDLDWEQVIQRAVESPQIEMEFKSNQYEEVSEEYFRKKDRDYLEIETQSSRKTAFLEKLRSPSHKRDDTERNIPDWIFDENGDLKQNELETNKQFPYPGAPAELRDQEEMLFSGDDAVIYDTEIEANLPDGLKESDTQSLWISETEVTDQKISHQKTPQLDDTQEINISDADPLHLLDTAEKAIEGENIQFAIKTFRHLITLEDHLDEITNRLEVLVNENPDLSELLLLLGEVYTRQGKKAEALLVYKKAQKIISL